MNKHHIKRILIALDASDTNRSTLQAATALAQRLDAELSALFVEDINLLHLAELPFAREVATGSAQGKPFNVTQMERSIQMQTRRMQKLVESVAQQNRITIAFDVLRGDITSLVPTASKQTDLLVMSKNIQLLHANQITGSTTQNLLASLDCSLALLQRYGIVKRPLVVLFDGSEASQHALALATQLAQDDHNQLMIMYPATDEESRQQIENLVTAQLGHNLIRTDFTQLPTNTAEAIMDTIRQYHGSVLLLPSHSHLLESVQIHELIRQLEIPTILLH